ncbi:MAG TPA: SusD/RagB family nutrient-binding outer membrane lipoprotein, partial [Chitinophagaceae bacterium]
DKGLYDTIAGLLTTAIAQLNNSTVGPDAPGGEDVLYGGTASNWIKFAHAIRARLYIHQSKGNATMATNALAEIALSFTANGDNAQYIFGSTETSANPWYQFNEQRGDIVFDSSPLGAAMKANSDPRFLLFTDPTFHDVNQVGMGPYYGNISSPVEFITYDELLFMKAEATLTSGGTVAAAQTLFQAAIAANMSKLGVSTGNANTYIAANGVLPGTSAAAIAAIAAQEYIALYLNPEAWSTWRRTNSPALTPIVGTAVPRRFLYPQTEYSYNGKNVPAATLFAPKVFWDN